ncbi:MAG: hypothetical protein ABJH04_07815 [Cyclobacteriaceae bacterium]
MKKQLILSVVVVILLSCAGFATFNHNESNDHQTKVDATINEGGKTIAYDNF